ncbi:uncharacterized protein LOC134775278 [Penaeus indicus]|uniref:uncharacterized protein LOC134775278 n=1 Tax=Penaeus indicus TaxID=29960 RepID=UPI00300DBC19
MSDLRLLLLVSLFSLPLSAFLGKKIHKVYPKKCSDYRFRGESFPSDGRKRTLFTILPTENTNDTLYVNANGTFKVILTYGKKIRSANLTTQLRIDLWKGGVKFKACRKKKCKTQEPHYVIQSNSTLVLSFDCPSDSQSELDLFYLCMLYLQLLYSVIAFFYY